MVWQLHFATSPKCVLADYWRKVQCERGRWSTSTSDLSRQNQQTPSVKFPSDWRITFTENHWSNEKAMLDHLEKILSPYIKKKRQELKLDSNYPALVIFDWFRGQSTDNTFALLEDNHVLVAVVPANCTDRLQQLDVSVNKAAKEFLHGQFQEWYSEQICHQLQEGNESIPQPVDLRMSIIKPLGAKWMISLYDYMKSKPDIIKNGFRHAGITASSLKMQCHVQY